MTNHFSRIGVTREVPFPGWVAPSTFRIPMPGLYEQLRVLAVADGTPTGEQDLLDGFGFEERIGGVAGNTVDRCAKGVRRAKRIHHMGWCNIHLDCLPRQ